VYQTRALVFLIASAVVAGLGLLLFRRESVEHSPSANHRLQAPR
jgi:hypothetical protein